MGSIARRRLAALSGLAAAIAVAAYLLQATTVYGATISHLTVDSRDVHARMAMTIVTPTGGGAGRPLLIFLHGRGGNQDSELSGAFFRALHALGRDAPDVAFPDGGDHSYFHDRRDGAWGRYIVGEAIPAAIRATGADPRRLAIGGISMGGFGAYDIARLHPRMFCAVGGHSAALWPQADDSAPGALDDARDFARHDVIRWAQTHRHPYARARLWLDGGDEDPFHAADEELAAALHIHMHVWPGAHDSAYWNAHWRSYLSFYATALRADACA